MPQPDRTLARQRPESARAGRRFPLRSHEPLGHAICPGNLRGGTGATVVARAEAAAITLDRVVNRFHATLAEQMGDDRTRTCSRHWANC